ncbi:MAG TPA: glycosyltransferase family 25 protein [Nitrosarchaeum sp.]|nr:glycosyltransferase family 25 protein [Nitrosarchaeum sp.]
MWSFPRSYYINLDSASHRRANIEALFKRLDVRCERKSAVIGKDVDRSSLKMFKKNKLSASEVGIFLSHYELWIQLLHDDECNYYAIFEDDIVTYADGNTLKKEVMDAIGEVESRNGDIIYLGKCGDICSKYERVTNKLYKTKHALCLHSYIIFKSAVRKILQRAPFSKPIDVELVNLCGKNVLDAYVFHPSIFYQDVVNNKSTLRNKTQSFYNIEECVDHRLYNPSFIEGFDTVPLFAHKVKIPIWIFCIALLVYVILLYIILYKK